MGQYHDLTFPNESSDYRAARDVLLTAEIELHRQAEKVSSLRQALPLGGALKKDYAFQNLSGEDVRFPTSELTPERKKLLRGTGSKRCATGTDSCRGGYTRPPRPRRS